MTFVEAASLNAESLTQYIVDTLKKHQLDPVCLVSQGYDGASVMSGRCSGVQERLKAFAPHAIYIHCYAHVLNLVLVDSVKAIPDATQFFALLETLYVFLSTTKSHVLFLEKQKKLHPEKQTRELQRLSDTRWSCRYSSVDAVCCTFDAVLATLAEIAEDFDGAKAIEATGLLLQVKSFKFLLSPVIFDRLLSITKSLLDALQSTSLDLARAADLVSATIETLEEFRSDHEWDHLFAYVESIANLHDIDVAGARPRRKRTLPNRLQETIVLEHTGSRELLTTNQQFKIALYYPILDAFLMEMKQRFNNRNVIFMRVIQACCPLSTHFLVPDRLKPLADCYDLDSQALKMEAVIAKRTLAKKTLESTTAVLRAFTLEGSFPNFA